MSWIYRLLDVIDPHTVDGVKSWHVAARTELPFAVPAAIVACGLVLACMNFLPHIILRFRRRFVLFLLRLLGLAAILVMILQLEAEVTFRRTRPAHVAVVVDTSESMALKDCDGQSRLAAATELAAAGVGPALRDRARLSWYAANWQLRDGAPAADTRPAGPTDLGRAVTECIERAGAPRAILLLTDGRSAYPRRVADAARIAKQSGVRVYGLGLGKAGPARAVSVHVTEADAYVRLGDELPLAADIRAEGLTGQTVDVFLYEDNDKKPRMQRKIELADRPVKVTFRYRPRKVGRRRYRIAVGAARGAVTDLANVSTTAVDVIDDPIRVLYVEGTPRFELKYLNNWLARDPVVELTTVTRMPKGGWFLQGKRRHKRIDEGFPVTTAELFDYDVLIFGDIPRAVFRQGGDVAETRLAQIASFVVKRGGGLITLGGQSVYGAGLYGGSALEALLPFRIGGIKRKQIPGFFHIQPVPAMLRHPVMALTRDVERLIGEDGDKLSIQVEEVERPELDAHVVAESIAEQLERRLSFRRVVRRTVSRTMRAGAEGIRVACKGRLFGAEMARREWVHEGRVPLHTLRADIDYAVDEAETTYGRIGVKVWIYRGDVFPSPDTVEAN